MTPERFQLISKIYRGALECTEGERVAFLERHCGGDPELRNYVQELLVGGKSAEAELLSLAMKESIRRLSEETPPALIGQLLDHYEVLSLVGSGGMGEVYKARDVHLGGAGERCSGTNANIRSAPCQSRSRRRNQAVAQRLLIRNRATSL